MLLTIEEAASRSRVGDEQIRAWIDLQWVLPVERDGGWLFDEVDVARIKLISELRGDLEVNDEAVPVVLDLIDQTHSLRRALSDLHDAIEGLSEAARGELEAQLRKITGA